MSFGGDVASVPGVLLYPRAVFRSLGGRSPVLAPWAICAVLIGALTLGALSITQRAASHAMSEWVSPEHAARVEENLRRARVVSVGVAPLALLARWLGTAALLWAPLALTGRPARYRAVLSVVAYSALPGVLEKGIDLAVVWYEGPEFTAEMVPRLGGATSLGALFPTFGEGAWTVALLEGLTPFSIWGSVLWAVGLQERLGVGRRQSSLIAGALWLGFWIVGASLDVLGRSVLGSFSPE